MIRLLIADDHKVLLDGICSYFSDVEDIEVVDTAYNGTQVLRILKERDIDILLLDINMPELNGVETCKLIAKHHADVKVIALSMYKQASYVKRMKSYGAKGYILKDDSASEMIKAIKKVYEGEEYYSTKLLSLMIANVLGPEQLNDIYLTGREKDVLELIAEGFSNKQIANKLILSVHTIDSHRKNLLMKFNSKNTAELVKKTMDRGLI